MLRIAPGVPWKLLDVTCKTDDDATGELVLGVDGPQNQADLVAWRTSVAASVWAIFERVFSAEDQVKVTFANPAGSPAGLVARVELHPQGGGASEVVTYKNGYLCSGVHGLTGRPSESGETKVLTTAAASVRLSEGLEPGRYWLHAEKATHFAWGGDDVEATDSDETLEDGESRQILLVRPASQNYIAALPVSESGDFTISPIAQ